MSTDPVRPTVMHVVLTLNPGGAERLVMDLATGCADHVASAVCCLDEAGAWAARLADRGVPVDVLGRTPGFHPSLGLRIAALAAHRGATVLHCHQYTPFVYGSLAGWRHPGLRIIVTEHGRLSDAPPSAKRRLVNTVLSRRPAAVVAVSHELRAFMVREGFAPSRLHVIHNGIPPSPEPSPAQRTFARRTLGMADDELVMGSVARFDPVKRLDRIIDACGRLRQTGCPARLVLVGDGPERPTLEAAIAAQDLRAAVILTGMRHDARDLLPAFDVFVNASDSEGISLTILEAMDTGLPVVATQVGGTPEVITSGIHGCLVERDDSETLSRAIGELLSDAERRSQMGAQARRRVAEAFSQQAMFDAYAALYVGAGRRR